MTSDWIAITHMYDQCRYLQGGRKHRTCVRCMQGVCGGFGTRRPSNQEAFWIIIKRPRGGRSAFYYFDDSFTSTRCLYLSPSQLCLIKRICTSYARAHTHTCPCAYARARTLAARESRGRQKCMPRRMDTGSLMERLSCWERGFPCGGSLFLIIFKLWYKRTPYGENRGTIRPYRPKFAWV